jgi:hypothetical protein
MLKQVTDTLGPLDPEAIREAERQIGVPLPQAYKQFLLKYNGGRPEPAAFRITWSGQEWADDWSVDTVHMLLGLRPGDEADFLTDFESYQGRIPNDTVPIGYDPGGNLLLLGVRGRNTGKVFFWMQDYEVEEGQTPDYSNVGFVASSFSEFLDSLVDM